MKLKRTEQHYKKWSYSTKDGNPATTQRASQLQHCNYSYDSQEAVKKWTKEKKWAQSFDRESERQEYPLNSLMTRPPRLGGRTALGFVDGSSPAYYIGHRFMKKWNLENDVAFADWSGWAFGPMKAVLSSRRPTQLIMVWADSRLGLWFIKNREN